MKLHANKPIQHYGKWRIRWVDLLGKRHSLTFDDRETAQLALDAIQTEMRLAEFEKFKKMALNIRDRINNLFPGF